MADFSQTGSDDKKPDGRIQSPEAQKRARAKDSQKPKRFASENAQAAIHIPAPPTKAEARATAICPPVRNSS